MQITDTIIKAEREVELGEFTAKATAITEGVMERLASVWTTEKVDTGVWEATPGSFVGKRDGYSEVCYITAGSATIEVEGEEDRELRVGDIFITPSGWTGIWHVHETIRKHYIIVND